MKDRDERSRGIEIRIVKKFDTILDFFVSSLDRGSVPICCLLLFDKAKAYEKTCM